MLLSCFQYRKGKYGCRCPRWAGEGVLPTSSSAARPWAADGVAIVIQSYLLCGRYLHSWLGFDRGRGTLGWEGRKDEKSFSRFIHVKVGLRYTWSVFAESPASPGQTLFLTYGAFPYRPEVTTIHRNKISRSGAGLRLWILLQSYAWDRYALWSAIRLEKTLNRWSKTWMWQVLSNVLCPCNSSTKGKQHLGFSS